MTPKRSKLVRWAGSKLSVAKKIEAFLDFSHPYIEPFAGSAIIYFRNKPVQAKLNDINSALVELYKDVQRAPELVWKEYQKLNPSKDTYYRIRAKFNDMESCHEKSAYFLFLNHFCFNGIYRTNLKNEYNTPYGGINLTKITSHDFNHYSYLLQNVELFCLDFQYFIEEINPKNLCLYFDPPYFTDEARVFREYGPKTFSAGDLRRLRYTCERLLGRDNQIVVSYWDCEEFRHLFGDFIVQEHKVKRNVGGFRARRSAQSELIAVL